jgi:predicted RNase H-like HicB family nuclease
MRTISTRKNQVSSHSKPRAKTLPSGQSKASSPKPDGHGKTDDSVVVYYAYFRQHMDGESYSVDFLDVPGCTSHGATYSLACVSAERALGSHLGLMRGKGFDVPRPSSIDRVVAAQRRDGPNPDELRVIFAPVLFRTKNKPVVRVNICVSPSMLDAIDAYAALIGGSRSGVLIDSVQESMRKRGLRNRMP